MKVISFFNNKGGVGKTTLAANVAAHFAIALGKRVLFVDCDPQCNSTQLILGEDALPELYETESESHKTVADTVQPIRDGDSHIIDAVPFAPASQNRFGIDVLPGSPRFALVEDRLSQAWFEASGGEVPGLRKTNWFSALCQARGAEYDYVFVDLGPSLGSINRSVLLGSDFFLTPMGSDIFSLYGIRNIADWLKGWILKYEAGVKSAAVADAKAFEKYPIRPTVRIAKGYAGYTLQQYIARKTKDGQRPTRAFDDIISRVPAAINDNLGCYFAPGLSGKTARLGVVSHMYSLIPLSQSVASPIRSLSKKDGLVGSQFKQARDYSDIIKDVAVSLASVIDGGGK